MTIQEFHRAFKLELDKTQSLELPAYTPEEIDFWINRAIENFVKTRYDGLNSKQESFEETQKRSYDLSTLVVTSDLTPESMASIPELDNFYNLVNVQGQLVLKPIDLLYIVNEEVALRIHTGNNQYVFKHSGVKDTTLDRLTYEILNPYSEYRLHYGEAKPLRVLRNDVIELISDGNYVVERYFLTYIRNPRRFNSLNVEVVSGQIEPGTTYLVTGGDITYNGENYLDGDTFIGVQDTTIFTVLNGTPIISMVPTNTDLPLHTHEELVKLAVKMALENIEQPRYQTYLNEVNTME